jgi:hypothetical protein
MARSTIFSAFGLGRGLRHKSRKEVVSFRESDVTLALEHWERSADLGKWITNDSHSCACSTLILAGRNVARSNSTSIPVDEERTR